MHETVTNLKALEIWTAQTLCDIGILLSVVSFLLHIGRSYFERVLGRFTLRVAADIWWVVYIILRDGSLALATVLGFWNLNLDLMADIKVALPFVPLGTVALAAALLVKVFRNAEDMNRSLRLSTWLVTLGAVLNTIGFVFVMEGPGDEYPAAKSVFWQTAQSWRSNQNPQLATITFYVTFLMLTVLVAIAVVKALQLHRLVDKPPVQNV
jgi:hypothetical protein